MDGLLVYALTVGLKLTAFWEKKTTQLKSYSYLAEKQANRKPKSKYTLKIYYTPVK